MASLLIWGADYGDSAEPDLKPEIGIHFESDGVPTDILLSLRLRRLRMASAGLPTIAGSFGGQYPEFLRAIAAVRPGDREIQDLVALERPSISAEGGEEGGRHSSFDCMLADLPESTDYDEEPVAQTQVVPTYPAFARDAMIQGRVILRVFIDARGRMCALKIVRSVTGLDDAAVNAVRQWTFSPARLKGSPVDAWVDVPMDFHF